MRGRRKSVKKIGDSRIEDMRMTKFDVVVPSVGNGAKAKQVGGRLGKGLAVGKRNNFVVSAVNDERRRSDVRNLFEVLEHIHSHIRHRFGNDPNHALDRRLQNKPSKRNILARKLICQF